MNYNFEWDWRKAAQNKSKHKVSFEEASGVFRDPCALSLYDDEHSKDEDRWLTLGISSAGLLLVVSHSYIKTSKDGCVIRIISARRATRREQKQYQV